MKPVPFCKLFAGLGSSNKSAISLLLSDFCSVLSSTFPFTSISLEDMEGTFFSPRVLSGYKGSPDTCFSQGTMQLMSWPDEEHYLCPLQSLVVSLLLSLVSTLLLSCTGGVLSHLNFLTRRFPQFPWRNLRSLIMLTVFSLSRESFLQHLQTLVSGHLSSHSAPSSYAFLGCLLFSDSWLPMASGPDPGELPGFWGSMVFHHAPIPPKGLGNNN